ncbi:hypothetical protein BUE80_DR000244 [Diplocarpon rosae]|nr:hypothetical protein BUE80_DR000244 [Diplocarpon rosae]
MKLKRMNAGELARRAQQASESVVVSQAAKLAARRANPNPEIVKSKPEHGQQIFVLNHLQKNHVVYSLTRAMNNNAALAQIPFNGKKSVPAAIRKDLWHPMAQITFPKGSGAIGLSVFQKLREYRKRHELEWGDEIYYDPDKEHKGDESRKGGVRSRKDRNKMICDQKANSIADIAAVLNRLAAPGTTVALPKEDGNGEAEPASQDDAVAEAEEFQAVEAKPLLNIGLIGEGSGTQVEVLWRDLHDAEFASTWELNIEHGLLPTMKEEKQRLETSRLEARLQRIRSRLKAEIGSEQWDAMGELERDAAVRERHEYKKAEKERRKARQAKLDAMTDEEQMEERRVRREAYALKQAESQAKWEALTEEERSEIKNAHAARKQARVEAAKEEQRLKSQRAAAALATKQAQEEKKEVARKAYLRKQAESKAKWEALTEDQRRELRNAAAARKQAAIEAHAAKQAGTDETARLDEETK